MRCIFLFIFLTACQTSVRTIDICRLFPSEGLASCAKGDKQYELEFPAKLGGWYAFHEESLSLLGARLEECEIKGRLPADDTTWDEVNACLIDEGYCGETPVIDLEYYYAIDRVGRRKILDRLEFCTRR
jgi:hypothetical protein